MSSGLTLLGKFYSFDWIQKNHEEIRGKNLSHLECQTIEFCGRWLSGCENFEVRTSGSTGKPRKIVLTRKQMAFSARLTAEALDLIPGDSALVCLSPEYIAGMMMLVRGMELGLEMTVVAPSGNPLQSLGPAQQRLDFTALVPYQLETIISTGGADFSSLNRMKVILAGGAPVSKWQESLLQKIKPPVYLTFGMTETATHIALRRLNGPDASATYQILPSVEIEQDSRGCLIIQSLLTNNEKITTNDLVELASRTRFRWLGRIDNIINSGGIKIQPEKVEQALFELLPGIADGIYQSRSLFVCGLPDDRLGKVVTAIVEGEAFPQKHIDGLKTRLLKKLDRYEIPRKFVFLRAFVRTGTGKIDRQANIANLSAD